MRILVVEDDRSLLNAITTVFREEAYQVDEAESGDDGLFLAEQEIHDLLVLDIMLPEMSGLSIIQHLRSKSISTPVLLLTAKDSVSDRVNGLDVGADDYMVKPFAIPELLARVRCLIRRRSSVGSDGEINYHTVSIKPKLQDGYIKGTPLKLSIKEYELLEFFLLNKEQILTREQIFDRIWGFESETNNAIVDLYVHYLRKKLMTHECDHFIQTVRNIGYKLKFS